MIVKQSSTTTPTTTRRRNFLRSRVVPLEPCVLLVRYGIAYGTECMVLTVDCSSLRVDFSFSLAWQREGWPFEAREHQPTFGGVDASGLPEAFHRLAKAKVHLKSYFPMTPGTL